MALTYIPVRAYSTGARETLNSLYQGLAFDLTEVDLREREVIGASLQLSDPASYFSSATVRFSEPTGERNYGEFHLRDLFNRSLNPDAIADLQEAAGGFFWLDAMFQDAGGQPLPVTPGAATYVLLLAVADIAAAAAA